MAVFNWFQYPPARCQKCSLHPGICNKHFGHVTVTWVGVLLSIWTAYRMQQVTKTVEIIWAAIITRWPATQPVCMQSLCSLVICVSPVLSESGRPYWLFVILKFLTQLTDCHAIWRTHELLRWEQDAHHFIQNPEVPDTRLRTARFVAHSLICRNVLGCRWKGWWWYSSM